MRRTCLVVLAPRRISATFSKPLRIEQVWPSSSVCLFRTFLSSWRTLKHANSTGEIEVADRGEVLSLLGRDRDSSSSLRY